ncbi:hypothetical protein [Burkholderia ubonensis]|uniref:hypothetical protein n=1 Tax=Burkholderia ubonensis TaxID=101571 RepID=UPI000757953B|nr:hypothetical protein [Burkholderia ubonensis]KWI19381.1 hypothetical protein WM01_06510 [Burkholderia ubonensis]OJA97447.1 hypothetical protein BGV51_23520 [Burkholderia ubonensis]
MNISKRGDHLFAAGLWKAIGDVARSVRSQVGEFSEGRVLSNELFALQRELGDSDFDVTINKGRPVTGADAHSLAFGAAVRRFRLDMEALVFALKYRRSIDDTDPAARFAALTQANEQLARAKQYAMLTVRQFFDTVVDPSVRDQLLGDKPGGGDSTRFAVASAKLERVRRAIVESISKM